ncbi:MAG: hypothetical protein AB7O60_20230 [Variibacter sp.]
MANARSTVSMARTTPAQKLRGAHRITFSGGLTGAEAAFSMAWKWNRGAPLSSECALPMDSNGHGAYIPTTSSHSDDKQASPWGGRSGKGLLLWRLNR